jgi:uncharacterized protein YegP (UPF0339 family)
VVPGETTQLRVYDLTRLLEPPSKEHEVYFDIYKSSRNGQYWWVAKGENHKTLCSSELMTTKQACMNGIRAIEAAPVLPTSMTRPTSAPGTFRHAASGSEEPPTSASSSCPSAWLRARSHRGTLRSRLVASAGSSAT